MILSTLQHDMFVCRHIEIVGAKLYGVRLSHWLFKYVVVLG